MTDRMVFKVRKGGKIMEKINQLEEDLEKETLQRLEITKTCLDKGYSKLSVWCSLTELEYSLVKKNLPEKYSLGVKEQNGFLFNDGKTRYSISIELNESN
jgi:hypothetical protein